MKRGVYIALMVLAFFSAWELVLRYVNLPEMEILNVFERNVARIEQMQLSGIDHYDVVLVGASSTASFDIEKFGKQTYNLSMEGGVSLTGLMYLAENEIHPKRIIIEANSINRLEDDRLLKMFSNPVRTFLRHNFHSFRIANKPGYYLTHFLNMVIDYSNHHYLNMDLKFPKKEGSSILQQIIDRNVGGKQEIDELAFQSQVEKMEKLLPLFEANGSEIIFIELPHDKRVNETPLSLYINDFFKRFCKDKYLFVEVDRTRQYETTDGIHLTHDELKLLEEKVKAALHE